MATNKVGLPTKLKRYRNRKKNDSWTNKMHGSFERH